jgi:hypothetical protein
MSVIYHAPIGVIQIGFCEDNGILPQAGFARKIKIPLVYPQRGVSFFDDGALAAKRIYHANEMNVLVGNPASRSHT